MNDRRTGNHMKRHGIRIVACCAVAALLLLIAVFLLMCFPSIRTCSPELVAYFPLGIDYQQQYPAAFTCDSPGRAAKAVRLWFPVSEYPFTEAGVDSLRELIGEEIQFDFDCYTYAVSLGCTIRYIRKATYPLADVYNGYRYGEATAVLSRDCPGDQVFLYRIPKDWIDIKYYTAFDGNYVFCN